MPFKVYWSLPLEVCSSRMLGLLDQAAKDSGFEITGTRDEPSAHTLDGVRTRFTLEYTGPSDSIGTLMQASVLLGSALHNALMHSDKI